MAESEYLAIGGQNTPYLKIYRTSDWGLDETPVHGLTENFADLSYSPDNAYLACGLPTSAIVVLETTGYTPISEVAQFLNNCTQVEWSLDGRYLCLALYNSPWMRIYDVQNNWNILPAPDVLPGDRTFSIAISADNSMVAVGTRNNSCRVYDFTDPDNMTLISPFDVAPSGAVLDVSFSPDGSTFWSNSGGETDKNRVYSVSGQSMTFQTSVGSITSSKLDYSQGSSRLLLSSSSSPRIEIYNSPAGTYYGTQSPAFAGIAYCGKYNYTDGSESTKIAQGGANDFVDVCDFDGVRITQILPAFGDIYGVAFSRIGGAPPVTGVIPTMVGANF